MTLQQLRYFIALGQHLHFGEAARACYVSQPSLSQSIAELEKELEVPLILRNSRSVTLTVAGTAFYESAVEIIRLVDSAIVKARRVNCGMQGHLRIGTLGGLSASFPSVVRKFKTKYPELDIELRITNMSNMHLDLLHKNIDLGLTRAWGLGNKNPNMQWLTIDHDRFCLIFPKDYDPLHNKPVNLSEFAQEPFIAISREASPYTYNRMLDICMRRGFSPNIIYQAATMEELVLMVKAGLGCAIVPDCAVVYGRDDLQCLEIEGDDVNNDVALVWNSNNDNPIIQLFLEELKNSI